MRQAADWRLAGAPTAQRSPAQGLFGRRYSGRKYNTWEASVRTRSQIAACWVVAGMAACAFLAAPAIGQIRQTSPEAQLACQVFDQANGMRPVLASALAGDAEAFPKLQQHMDALRTLMAGNLPPSL